MLLIAYFTVIFSNLFLGSKETVLMKYLMEIGTQSILFVKYSLKIGLNNKVITVTKCE